MLKELRRHKKKKVFVGMSGGVDSSVAALMLKNKGYDVVGVFMRCYDSKDGCSKRDSRDAALVAQKLKIPFYIWDFRKQYEKKVIKYMIDGYKKGLTPNPDVMCNKEIKFGLFLERALKLGADYVATGHYARLKIANCKLQNSSKNNLQSCNSAILQLVAAKDKDKDQSYFLWTLTHEQLKRCLFPIGDYLKPQVRKIAKAAGLITADKKDSQGVCFLGKIKIEDFLKKYIPKKKGKVLDSKGKVIGEHSGIQFYTIGQRHIKVKFQIPSAKSQGDRKPYYVAEKNKKTNTLVVAEGSENPALYKKEVELINVNFSDEKLKVKNKKSKILVMARVRYRQPLFHASLTIDKSSFKLVFAKPVKFVAPGQSAVFYNKKGALLGGGVII
ncbi:tRNA 2-thiouridine(34) synthase MnmA [Candidatus Wolfebacteria bacterium]|nr:tRNA 2-thiouridine(34) synthase MnmA [Candidatus Wolfebacteria bacterium]NCO44558.1 tRNA 2-thiouridine(34) synthase MnmA [Candidatus Wolfebacteria bacterium]